MNITPVNNANYKNNQPAFGMNIKFKNEDAFHVASYMLPKEKLEKVMPDVLAMKTKNGAEILVDVFGDREKSSLTFNATAEGEKVKDVVIASEFGENTYKDRINFAGSAFDALMPTLKGIKDSLDDLIDKKSEKLTYLKQMFGDK